MKGGAEERGATVYSKSVNRRVKYRQRVDRVWLLIENKPTVKLHFYRKLGEIEHGLGIDYIKKALLILLNAIMEFWLCFP